MRDGLLHDKGIRRKRCERRQRCHRGKKYATHYLALTVTVMDPMLEPPVHSVVCVERRHTLSFALSNKFADVPVSVGVIAAGAEAFASTDAESTSTPVSQVCELVALRTISVAAVPVAAVSLPVTPVISIGRAAVKTIDPLGLNPAVQLAA